MGLGAIAPTLLIIGAFGLFGQERAPFAALLPILLGPPWVHMIDALPETLRPRRHA